jgi:hypothetical protein
MMKLGLGDIKEYVQYHVLVCAGQGFDSTVIILTTVLYEYYATLYSSGLSATLYYTTLDNITAHDTVPLQTLLRHTTLFHDSTAHHTKI